MKFSKFGRATLAAVLSLSVSAAFTACGPNGYNNTVDYVYVTNAKTSQINVYYTDAHSGALTQISGSPFASGGTEPVALVTSPNLKNLYVVNESDNSIVEFTIDSGSAKLTQANKYSTPGTLPNSVSINAAGTLLFVTDKLAPNLTTGPGALVVFPIAADGSLGTPVANGTLPYFPLNTGADVLTPTAVKVLTQTPVNATAPGATLVYVVSQNTTSGLGDISAFSVGTGGALTFIPCSSSASICDSTGNGTFNSGTSPNAVATTPRGLFLYVTDSVNNQLISYTVQSSGQIIPNTDGPTRTDVFPDSVTVDPRGMYIYVANYTANSVSAYTINVATGYPTGVASAGSYATGTGPSCVFVEPALGRFVYTTNFLDNTVTGLNLNPNTGTLAPVQNTPFIAAGNPTCVTATPHGNYPIPAPVT